MVPGTLGEWVYAGHVSGNYLALWPTHTPKACDTIPGIGLVEVCRTHSPALPQGLRSAGFPLDATLIN